MSESEKRVPDGALRRALSLARAGASLAVSGTFSADALAERAVASLADLRGLGTKAGQMAAIGLEVGGERFRALVPTLSRLRSQAANSPWVEVRASLERDLGRPLSEVFESFDEIPFASASIGQVHRASYRGTSVAVKVQHPGIDAALRHDLNGVGRLGSLLGPIMLGVVDGHAVVDAVRTAIESELDYAREADAYQRFRTRFEGDADLVIPRVMRDASTSAVLTTEFVIGTSVEEAAHGIHVTRQGAAIRRFVLESWLTHGELFADPHPGNWIFLPDGRVAVIDFGCVVPVSEETRLLFARTVDALRSGGLSFRAEASQILSHADPRLALGGAEVIVCALEPLVLDRRALRRDLAEIGRLTEQAKRRMIRTRHAGVPSWLPMTLRTVLGTVALLAKLEDPQGGTG